MIDNGTQITVTVEHIRAANLCGRGARQWFSRHGLDWTTFVDKGLPVEQIEGTNDALGSLVAGIARKAAAGDEQ